MQQDWADLWRPELAGRISMVDSPREVIGVVLKHMGASYNTQDIHLQVDGGRDAVKQNLALLGKQVLRSNFFFLFTRILNRAKMLNIHLPKQTFQANSSWKLEGVLESLD